MIGISDQVRAKAERFNRDTTRKYENQTSEQAVLAALKGSIVAAADRCEKALPTQLQQLRSALAGEGDSLGARWATFESQSQAQRVTRLQVQSASPPPTHTHRAYSLGVSVTATHKVVSGWLWEREITAGSYLATPKHCMR
jgi:hypothetical protein